MMPPYYVEPTVIEVLEAANGLRDPDDLGRWVVEKGRSLSEEQIKMLNLVGKIVIPPL